MNNSDPNQEQLEDFETDPLVGLGPKKMHEMSPEERRVYIQEVRAYRQSFPQFKAEVERRERERVEEKEARSAKERKKVNLDEFKELF